MFLTFANGLAFLRGSAERFEPERLAPIVGEIDRARILLASKIRHARYGCFATAAGACALAELLPFARGRSRVVVTMGDPVHLEVATAFGERLESAGHRRLNPLMFPHTLPSATAVTLGAAYGAHSCSIAMSGSDPWWQGLAYAELLLDAAVADEVFLFYFSEWAEARVVALGFLASTTALSEDSVEFLDVDHGGGPPAETSPASAVEFILAVADAQAGTIQEATLGASGPAIRFRTTGDLRRRL